MSDSTVEIQKVFLTFMLSDPSLYTRVQNIYNPENFDRSLKAAAKFIHSHAEEHSAIPNPLQIKAVTGTQIDLIDNIQGGHSEWFLEEFEQFTRREELKRAIFKSVDLLEKDDFGPVEKLIKDAVQISLTRDMGLEYFLNPRERLLNLKNSNGQLSTGWADIDKALFGGFNRGELNIFAGGPGSGKSVFLQNISLNWLEKGLNGVYVTLELSRELVAMRLDSMITGICSKDIFKNLDEVELKVSMAGKKSGRLKIKFLPSGSTVNDMRAYLKELSIKENFKPDFLSVDYLDLINPNNSKFDLSDIFTKDKLVSEDLRNLAIELNSLLVSASQLGRSSFEEIEFNLGNIAGGISKANSADNLFGIYTSRIMRERGMIQLQFMKTRNSSGVGSKVDLDFDVNSLRISDSSSNYNSGPVLTGTNVLAQIKNGPKPTETKPNMNISDKQDLLKSLLSNISK